MSGLQACRRPSRVDIWLNIRAFLCVSCYIHVTAVLISKSSSERADLALSQHLRKSSLNTDGIRTKIPLLRAHSGFDSVWVCQQHKVQFEPFSYDRLEKMFQIICVFYNHANTAWLKCVKSAEQPQGEPKSPNTGVFFCALKRLNSTINRGEWFQIRL